MLNYNVPDVLERISQTHCEGAILHIKMKKICIHYSVYGESQTNILLFVYIKHVPKTENHGFKSQTFRNKTGYIVFKAMINPTFYWFTFVVILTRF